MSLLSGLVKLGSNVLSGGAGSKKTETAKQSSNTSSSESTVGRTIAQRKEYSDGFLRNLEVVSNEALKRNLANSTALAGQREALDAAQLGQNPINFDADAYIRGVTQAAGNTINNQIQTNTNAIAGNTGGSASGNSQAALLANRLATDGASQLAGITAEATRSAMDTQLRARGQQVDELATKNNILSGLSTANDAGLATLLNSLRGGETYQEVDNRENRSSNSKSSGSSTAKAVVPFNWQAGLGNIFKDVDQD
jgi:hypothetical protein